MEARRQAWAIGHAKQPKTSLLKQLGKKAIEVREQQKEECGQCGKRYSRRGIVKHMKEKHGEKLKCNICNEELETEKTLENLYAKKHIVNTIAFLECSSCEYKTMNKYYGPREKATRQWKHREFQQFCLFKVLLKKTQ